MKWLIIILSVIFIGCDTCSNPVGNGGTDSEYELYFTALPLSSDNFNFYKSDINGNYIEEVIEDAYSFSVPSKDGIIAFVREDSNSQNLLLTYNVTSGKISEIDRQNSLFDIINPVISSDGKFISFLGGSGKLFIYNMDDGFLELLTGSVLSSSVPSFSPDGSKIAYFDKEDEIKLIIKNTNNLENTLIEFEFSDMKTDSKFTLIPNWTSDSGEIIFSLFDDELCHTIIANMNGETSIINTNLNEIKIINPSLNQNEDFIAFNSDNGNIWICEKKSYPLFYRITDNNDKFFNSHPVWSPDGNKLCYSSTKRDGVYEGNLILSDIDLVNSVNVSKTVIVSNNCLNYFWR